MAAKKKIYSVNNCLFDVGGTNYPVTSFDMTLSVGTIPMATIGVDLRDSTGPSIDSMQLGTLKSRFGELLASADSHKECEFYLELEESGENGTSEYNQKLQLKDWILVAVGIGEVTTTDSFGCKCTIAHPAYKLVQSGGFCNNWGIYPNPEKSDIEKVTNPLDAGVTQYREFKKKLSGQLEYVCSDNEIKPNSANQSGINETIQNRVEKVIELLGGGDGGEGGVLSWDPSFGGGSSGIPFNSYISGTSIEMGVKKAMIDLWAQQGTGSVWSSFASRVCPDLGVTVIPDYMKPKLPVSPFYPWVKPSLIIDDTSIFEILFPGTDPDPIYGVSGSSPSQFSTNLTLSCLSGNNSQNLSNKASVLAFVPNSDADANGTLYVSSTPGWLVSGILQGASLSGGHSITPTNYLDSDPVPNDAGAGKNVNAESAGNARGAWLASQFLRLFKRKVESSITCPLLLDDSYFPGKVVSVVSDGSCLYEGYMTSLSHTLNMKSGYGMTALHMNYCRPEGGYAAVETVMGDNPMYS